MLSNLVSLGLSEICIIRVNRVIVVFALILFVARCVVYPVQLVLVCLFYNPPFDIAFGCCAWKRFRRDNYDVIGEGDTFV